MGSSNFMGQLKELFDAWASPGALQYVADSAPGAIQQWQCSLDLPAITQKHTGEQLIAEHTAHGCGRSKKEAEQACAHDALCYIAQIPGLGVPPPPPLKPPASWLSEASAQASSPSSHDAASAPSSDSGCRGDSGSEGGAGSAAPAPVFLARGPPVAAHASPGPATPAGSRSAPQPQLQQQQPTPADVDSMSADQLRTALCESLAREARLQAQVERLWQLLHVAVEGAPDHGQRDG